jgi:predicted lipoprotein with Yx(FWY)xxD motif
MVQIKAAGAFLIGMLVVTGCAMTDTSPVKYAGGVMVDSANMTLYTFDKDPAGAGKSVCNEKCAVNWPPFKAAADSKASGDFTVVTRDDGSRQWAYKGQPLYLWIKDTKPGDKTGDGVNNVWHVVKQPQSGGGSMY